MSTGSWNKRRALWTKGKIEVGEDDCSSNQASSLEESPPATCANGSPQSAVPLPETSLYQEEKIGGWIGPYELLEEIGEGTYGIVFRVRQYTPIQRELALKVLKPGMDSRRVLARFRTEHRSLALMNHPSIAAVFDAGATQSGLPYFVMELANGQSLIEYCDSHRLTVAERLQVFSKVCDAVQHAHSKGVIHRDLKPQNILVHGNPADAQLKVIDFGVAHWIHGDRDESTLQSVQGELLGTLQYMSPEQSSGDHARIDSRSDVYSLGLVLHEVLTGTTAYSGQSGTATVSGTDPVQQQVIQPLRAIRNVLNCFDGGRIQAAAIRPTQTLATRKLKGELGWMIAKAIDLEPDRRYETARGLRDDIERYLAGEPIAARPPSLFYLLRKRLQQRQARWLIRTAYVAVAVLFLIATSLLYREFSFRYRLTTLRQLQARANGPLKTADPTVQGKIYREIYALQRELIGEDDIATLWTQMQIVKAYSEGRQPRQAVALGEATLTQVRRKLGDTAPYTRICTLELVNSYIELIWQSVNPNGLERTEPLDLVPYRVDRALTLCDRLEGYVPVHRMMLLLHLASYYALQGDAYRLEQTSEQITKSGYLNDFCYWPRAILYQTQSDPLIARQCLHVIQDRGARWFFKVPRHGWGTRYCRDMNTWTSQYVGLPRVWQYDDPPPDDLLQTYSALLEVYPTDPSLLFGRGINWARADDWGKAVGDFQAAAAERADVFECWEALAISQLRLEMADGYREACRQAIQRFGYFPDFESRLLCLCALSPDTTLSPEQLAHHVKELSIKDSLDQLARAWSLYRLGRYEEVLGPIALDSDPLTLCAGPMIQAMALHQLGQVNLARVELDRAREAMVDEIPSAIGPPIARIDLPERPLCRAILEILLAEAENLIHPEATD